MNPISDCQLTPCKRQYSFAKDETPKFDGHVMPNKNENRKSVQLKFRYSFALIIMLVFWLHAYWWGRQFEIGYFRNFRTSLALDWVVRQTVVYHSQWPLSTQVNESDDTRRSADLHHIGAFW